MKNKSIVLQAKLGIRQKALDAFNAEIEELHKRSDEIIEAIDAVETEDDLNVIETEVNELQAQLDEKEASKKLLEDEIDELKNQLQEQNEKKPEQGVERNMKKATVETRDALNKFIKSKGEEREGVKLVDGGVLIPVEILKPTTKPEVSLDLTEVVNVVKVNSSTGKYGVIEKSKQKMPTTAELEKNPELGKFKITNVEYSVKTYRGSLAVSQEMIDDADYDVMGLIGEDAHNQELTTKNYAICEILKTASPQAAQGLDGLKDVLNTKIKSVYNIRLIVTDSMFNALDKVKDKTGRYMLQQDVTSPTGYRFSGKIIQRVPDEMLGAEGEMKAFIGDPKAFVTLFDRTATTAKWVNNDIYGEVLALFTRFDTKKTDEAAGKFVTYTDAV